ncbi:MAG: TrkH family potassium uptake protein [bacterium]
MKLKPGTLIALSFFLVILIGGILLSLPISSASGHSTNFLDSYFTANSATCVTGLIVLDTGTYFSLFGLIVLIFLMQVGGLGYMTFSVFAMLVLRKKLFVSERLMMQEALNIYSGKEVADVLKKIFAIVFTIEGIGMLILFLRWAPELGVSKGILYAVFHAVSAFNNAGFALPPNFANLSPYVTDIIINLTITTLIIIGGMGFIVISDVLKGQRLSLHSKITIATTAILIALGTAGFLFLEYSNPSTLGPLSLGDKMLASYFQAVTPRTAGFHTLNTGTLFVPTLIMVMFLMFIGASPGGTGGGIKTSTFAVLIGTIRATLKGLKDTVMFRRRIPHETVRRAFTITTLSVFIVVFAVLLLNYFEKFSLLESAFEVFSAFGTVGLSMGITPKLSSIGKLIIIVVMFIGRVGPLSLALTLLIQQKEPKVEYPKEYISIG